jgi:LysR family transcriptional regulator, chromosome initiation inhibitor
MTAFDLDQLQALAATVAAGTMDGAAHRLHVTPSAISQRIRALETAVGQVLLVRSRPAQPTSAGEKLLKAARQIEIVIADAARELGAQGTGGPTVVRIGVNADSLATWLLPALASMSSEIIFDLRRADQAVTAGLLRDGSVMAAISASAQAVPGCTVTRLGRMRYQPRASREFAGTWFPDGASAQELAQAPMVVFDRDDQLQDSYLRCRSRRRLNPPRHYVPGSHAFIEAIRLGLGWGMVPDIQANLASAPTLVEIDPEGTIDVPLFWHQWRFASSPLREFAEAVRRQAADALR